MAVIHPPEFEEFVALIARIKRGDQALSGFLKMVDTLNNSPIKVLEEQALDRGLDVSYKMVEVGVRGAVLVEALTTTY